MESSIVEPKELELSEINIDKKLNVRNSVDNKTVERYTECFEQLPPIVVFETDDGYLLTDGFHRVEAAKRLERENIKAEIREGTRQDAEEHAALANLQHGKPLTRTERRKAVERMLMLYPERSASWIAEDTGVSDKSVRKYREELENSNSEFPRCSTFITKDGREFPREIEQPKKDEQTSDEQVDEQSPETTQEVPDEQPQVPETAPTSEDQPQAETPIAEQVADAEPQAEQPETDAVEAQTDELVDEVEQEVSVEIMAFTRQQLSYLSSRGVARNLARRRGRTGYSKG